MLSRLGERIGAKVAFTRSIDELRKALEYFVDIEPAVARVQYVMDVVHNVDDAINKFLENLKALKLDDAQRSLYEFQGLFARNQQSFDRASEQRLSANFQLFWKLAREDRDVQAQLLKLGSDWIRHAKESGDRPSDEMIGVKEKWNAVMKQGNDNLGAMNTKANEIVDELIKQRK